MVELVKRDRKYTSRAFPVEKGQQDASDGGLAKVEELEVEVEDRLETFSGAGANQTAGLSTAAGRTAAAE